MSRFCQVTLNGSFYWVQLLANTNSKAASLLVCSHSKAAVWATNCSICLTKLSKLDNLLNLKRSIRMGEERGLNQFGHVVDALFTWEENGKAGSRWWEKLFSTKQWIVASPNVHYFKCGLLSLIFWFISKMYTPSSRLMHSITKLSVNIYRIVRGILLNLWMKNQTSSEAKR